MASVDKRGDGRPKGWLVRWRDEAGRQRKKAFARKVDADRFRAEVEHSLNTGAYIDPAAGRKTFRDYAEAWRKAQPHRPNTAKRTELSLAKHAYPVIGDRRLASIRPSEVQAWVTGLDLSASSVRPIFSTVRAIFAAAVRDRMIARTPVDHIVLPEVPREHIVPLTVEQVHALIDAMPPDHRALTVVGAGAGLRRGELFGLQVGDIDFLRQRIKVQRQVQLVGNQPTLGPLKTSSSYRTVPVGQVVIDALAAHLAARGAGAADPASLVFRNTLGGMWSPPRFLEAVWRPARTAAGLVDVNLHDLRHFYASALIRAGLNVKVVSARLGHANAVETLNTYSHLWPDDEDRTRQAIDDVLSAHVPHMSPEPVAVPGASPGQRPRRPRPADSNLES